MHKRPVNKPLTKYHPHRKEIPLLTLSPQPAATAAITCGDSGNKAAKAATLQRTACKRSAACGHADPRPRPHSGRTNSTVASSAASTKPMVLFRLCPTAKAVGYTATTPTGLASPAKGTHTNP